MVAKLYKVYLKELPTLTNQKVLIHFMNPNDYELTKLSVFINTRYKEKA